MKSYFTTVALIAALAATAQNASVQTISVQTIPTLGQLPVNAIHRIFQDSEGYIWYGTVNGLCRDDGYRIHVFRSDINTPGLLDNNLIECITEDCCGKIWFGTDKGAYILDKKDYSIRPLDPERLKGRFIYRADPDPDGYVWISISGRLLKYSASGELAGEYHLRNDGGDAFAGGFCRTDSGEIYITLSSGPICRLDTATDAFVPFPAQGLKRLNPNNLYKDEKRRCFWVPMWRDGIARFDPQAGPDSMYVYQPMPLNAKGEENGIILYLAQDNDLGYLWCTTGDNLTAFEPDASGTLRQVDVSALLPPANRMLNDIIKDRYGNLWVAAFDQPSFIIRFIKDIPLNYPLPAIRRRVNGNPAVMSLVDGGDGIFWISQERTGVFLYDINSNRQACYLDFPATAQLPLHTVKQMCPASAVPGGAWISPENSRQVYLMARRGMAMEPVDAVSLDAGPGAGTVQYIFEDPSLNLWIGTSNGLYSYNPETKTVKAVTGSLGFVSGITCSPSGAIWACSAGSGIHKISAGGQVEASYPFPHAFSSITVTSNGDLWLGSEEGGVYAFYPREARLENFSRACDMNGDQVNRVVADVFNHIWISTNQKLVEFNPRNKSFYNYLASDETMLLHRLIPTSATVGRDSRIYFGGIPGMMSVAPSNRLESEAREARATVTNVKVAGRSLIFGGCKPHNSLSAIRLSPGDSHIEIEFSSLNHCAAGKIRYAYKLGGVDAGWNYPPAGQNTAHYNRLPQGSYPFEVKATDENGLWSPQVSTLMIRRLPAFYETWQACVIYALTAAAIAALCILLYIRRRERRNRELWSDSEEMVKMRRYLKAELSPADLEFAQLDRLLLEKATRTVEAGMAEPEFDVTRMARSMNMSASTLSRKLKAITGLTPLNFIRNIKMQHACRLLRETDLNISEVSLTLGYFNRKNFSASFKEEFGVTPSEYKKREAEKRKDAGGEAE
ncbi:MAG: helix-turn-helix domain-containing protein [Tannerellaceae bacterium]|jgi:ligand-binding sensor domain-containing protein/AraC-like DNA-binding protein|nr:helix-turn-helix domain-containing protein [Tannerellaceae bacterium]